MKTLAISYPLADDPTFDVENKICATLRDYGMHRVNSGSDGVVRDLGFQRTDGSEFPGLGDNPTLEFLHHVLTAFPRLTALNISFRE